MARRGGLTEVEREGNGHITAEYQAVRQRGREGEGVRLLNCFQLSQSRNIYLHGIT